MDLTATGSTTEFPLILHPSYYGPITMYAVMVQGDNYAFEDQDNYQKQTYRNRTYIYGASGKLALNIPVKHSKTKTHQKYKDVKIENAFTWQKVHWKSLETAYRTSPYFEFYEDEIVQLYNTPYIYLLDYNYRCMEIVCSCLGIVLSSAKTITYDKEYPSHLDGRKLVNAKSSGNLKNFESYPQVFEDKYGFIPNLSILDLLFNEGTNAKTYLQRQEIKL